MVTGEKITIYKDVVFDVSDLYLSIYEETEHFFLNYQEAIALCGVRRKICQW